MSPTLPSLTFMLEALIATPSVSSVDPGLDQSNQAVIERLADWLRAAGFCTEPVAVPDHSGKVNLIATLGTGPGGWCWRGTRIRFPATRNAGTMTPSASRKTMAGSTDSAPVT